LWANICSLMGSDAPSLDAVAKLTKVGRGTVQRIKDGQTNIEAKNIALIAEAFSLEAWQLLVPDLDAKNKPTLGAVRVVTSSPLSSEVVARIANAGPAEILKLENRLRVEFDLPLIGDTGNDLAAA
jgi:transcriptional regulator with XRE-family HTH domain